jgi:hypothetical protein
MLAPRMAPSPLSATWTATSRNRANPEIEIFSSPGGRITFSLEIAVHDPR